MRFRIHRYRQQVSIDIGNKIVFDEQSAKLGMMLEIVAAGAS